MWVKMTAGESVYVADLDLFSSQEQLKINPEFSILKIYLKCR